MPIVSEVFSRRYQISLRTAESLERNSSSSMPYQKFRPAKQWGRANTRYFKSVYANKLKERMPVFRVPDVLQVILFQIK